MKKLIIYILFSLLGTTVFSSCSVEIFDSEENKTGIGHGKRVIITGIVSDADSGSALEDITIHFKAYPQKNPDAAPVVTDEVHTGSNGAFTIMTPPTKPDQFLCTLTATDPDGQYESHTKQIIITWEGTSYDKDLQMYVVNNCNFQLKKTK